MQLSVSTTLRWTLLIVVQSLHLQVTCLLWLTQKLVEHCKPNISSISWHSCHNTFSSASSIIIILSSLYILRVSLASHYLQHLIMCSQGIYLIKCHMCESSLNIVHVFEIHLLTIYCISRATLRIVGIKAKVYLMHVQLLVHIISP